MKRTAILGILLALSLSFASTTHADVEYEGEINPNTFWSGAWGFLGSRLIIDETERTVYVCVILKNPDAESAVKTVELIYMVSGNRLNPIAYAYEKDGVQYIFVYDPTARKFIRLKPDKV